MQHTISGPGSPPLAVDLKTREQAAYEALRKAIIGGRWRPNQSLVVSHIAVELGMSRIPVGNAVKRLASDGFVQIRPHQEATVAPLDAADIREIYLMRASLEVLAITESIGRVTPTDIVDLRAINEELRRAVGSPGGAMAEIRAIDGAFHARMREIAGMPQLAQTLQGLADRCEYYRASLLDQSQLAAPSADRHEPLIHALETHDREHGARLQKTHILEGMNVVLSVLAGAS